MGMKTTTRKKVAVLLLIIFFGQMIQPTVVWALTSGPKQPEFTAFEPATTTQMVDLFSGDFTYNIPLFELPGPNGGYPFNLAYHAGIGMEQEASWVGLGWSLNPGALNRQMRGLPDEFKGDDVTKTMAMKPSVTVGVGGGVGVEVFGANALKGNLGMTLFHNNYKGVGYNIDGGFGYSMVSGSIGLNLGFSLNSQEGASLRPSLGLSKQFSYESGDYSSTLSLGLGYNSRLGLTSMTLNSSISQFVNYTKLSEEGIKNKSESFNRASLSSSLSLSSPGFTPSVSAPTTNINISASLNAGGAWWGIEPNAYISGFYNEQKFKKNGSPVSYPAYGYLNYQHATDEKDLIDVNRENDGLINEEIPNLPIPSMTYDIFSASGQGFSMMYRAFRNDIGILHDQKLESDSYGGSVGADVAPAASHVGANLGLNHSLSYSQKWSDNNAMTGLYTYQGFEQNDTFEPWYFKAHGEPTSVPNDVYEQIGGDEAVKMKISGNGSNASGSSIIKSRSGEQTMQSVNRNAPRVARNQYIQAFTNEQLLNNSNDEVFKLFEVGIDRSAFNAPHHMAGYITTNPQGLRYVYALPVYNQKHEEYLFSAKSSNTDVKRVNVKTRNNEPDYKIKDTNEFLEKTEIPPYAHTYLLTAIVGPDYVDRTNDGVTFDDLGYWVKFTYDKAGGGLYKWRSPFAQANYIKGLSTTIEDDKASFQYGEKELYYLARVETKSHIAEFETSNRSDGRSANSRFQNTSQFGPVQMKQLDDIYLYARKGTVKNQNPIKRIHFEYNYELCPQTENSASGKLTLKKLWFQYGNSARGQFNPYQFYYENDNPAYDMYAIDRWGNFKPYSNYTDNLYFPYVKQDPENKEELDQNMAAWSLSRVRLPSGGEIMVDYESDDYAFVQHFEAMQMTKIESPADGFTPGDGNSVFDLDDDNLKIRFKLETPIDDVGQSVASQRAEVMKYIDNDRKQLYFKYRINLRKREETTWEYVSGYVDIDMAATMGLEKASGSDDHFTYGYFYLLPDEGWHPISKRAWQHLRVTQPNLASMAGKLKTTGSNAERVKRMRSLLSIVNDIRTMFTGYYNYANNRNWGRAVDSDHAWVRLNSPDLIKYGGGLRVKQITMKDNWQHDEEGIYGQVYEYTRQENGQTISSGVAAYEPLFGGEENPLRYAKKYNKSVPLIADQNMFFEYPVNESYYPGPQVGYSQVTVMSLASAAKAGKALAHITLSDGNTLFPEGDEASYGTTGKTVHEFFTAREFPVITKETSKTDKPFKAFSPIPLLGVVSVQQLTTSQGYKIETNDMHGKQKATYNYRQANDGTFEESPISYMRYHYQNRPEIYDGRKVKRVDNLMEETDTYTVQINNGTKLGPGSGNLFRMGQEQEFFFDMREQNAMALEGGVNLNIDVLYIPIFIVIVPVPITAPWPNVSSDTKMLRSAVANKVVFKRGIMTGVEAYDGGSKVVTEHLKWDKLTGQPVLSRVNNNFDEHIYSHTMPAYHQYSRMGARYEKEMTSIDLSNIVATDFDNHYRFSSGFKGSLKHGDLLLVTLADQKVMVRVVEKNIETMLYSTANIATDTGEALLIASRSNQLDVNTFSYTRLNEE
ncbi:MAG TPA: hypothetical protein DDY13_11295 [Cytophagales bacterium]|nr:hypothetical protein [Cytophagales bacterium]